MAKILSGAGLEAKRRRKRICTWVKAAGRVNLRGLRIDDRRQSRFEEVALSFVVGTFAQTNSCTTTTK